jgi:hypothetical protein
MNLELTDEQAQVVRHALEVYLSDLRGEIVKTEKHEWKVGLHKEQEALESVVEKLK